ncbi:RsmB/NOP family class I SAM-dependent RNA methyltransferase [Chryseolinea sp. H1M3-3]|uniref:RsmB/NOP family class I SAM-dependent RNA methyltransferase n=1 Tax=Chryseolinea sp. H1M3-3 TaxID=3034144 RepID=UPI0023EDC89C|nr:RsmB/NOP family class I SAM-dependent RNA methyltransferase [Chryseolinea sp. H1M3-3]
MKLFVNLARAVISALEMIFEQNRYADKVIEKILKQNPKWGARDRRFIAETTYDIVRWYRFLQNITEAKENEYWKLLGGWCVLNQIPLPDWTEFKDLSEKRILERNIKMKSVRRFRESIPDWLDALGEKELGGRWEKELHALNEEAHVVLRVNTLKVSVKDLQRTLHESDIETDFLRDSPDALVLAERQNIFRHPTFKEGLFEVQDAASQFIAPFLRVSPGMRVIDACAGAGGKTLHLAALMKNKGRIIAMDVEPIKLEELQKRAKRAGVNNLEIKVIESSKTIKRLENSADRLLLDVPCSGLGVLKRNPDAKWKLSPAFIENVKELQQHILQDYCNMVKKDGLIVYSTCSVLPSENEQQIEKFMANNGEKFELLEQKHSWPSEGFDGFYMALLRKK